MKNSGVVPSVFKTLLLSTCIATVLGACNNNTTELNETTSTTNPKTTSGSTTGSPSTTNLLEEKTNIIYIMLDDTGIRDLGCYGNTFAETPNIDKLAEEGMLFTDFYTQPLCSPSRSALLTGQNVVRTGVVDYIPNQTNVFLDTDEFTTLPQMLQDNGYHTGILGKWHLSAGYENYPSKAAEAPEYAGFNEVIMSERAFIAGGDYFYPYFFLPQVTNQSENTYLVDNMNQEAIDFIERNQDEPFFLYFSHYATHINLDAPTETVEYFQNKRGERAGKNTQDRNPYLAAMLKHVDDGVGAIVSRLEELGLRDNTVIVITSDNGGDENFTSNGEYRAGKGTVYEGGIRDPLIINWPSKAIGVSNTPVSIIDFFQTFGEIAGIPLEEIPENEGLSLLPILNGDSLEDRDCLYWIFPRFGNLGGMAIRQGDFKYVESLATGKKELFNLKLDPGENNNIIDDNPEIYKRLVSLLHNKLQKDSVGKIFNADFGNDEFHIWKIVGDLNLSNNQLVYTGNTTSAMTLEGLVRHNLDMSVEITGQENAKAGVIFRANYTMPFSDGFRGYSAVLDFENDRVTVQVLNQDKAYPIVSVDYDLNLDQTYHFRLVNSGSNIKIYIDEQSSPIIDYDDYSFIMGTVGFYGKDGVAEFDNLQTIGIAYDGDYNDQQLQIKPNDDSVLRYNGNYLSFENKPFIDNGEAYFDLYELIDRLNIAYIMNGEEITIQHLGDTLVFDKDANQALLNDVLVDMPNLILVESNYYIQLKFIINTLGYGIKISEGYEGYNYTITSDPTIIVFDTNAMIEYTGNWVTLPSNMGAFGDTTTRSTIAGEEAILEFYGIGVKLYLGRGAGAGICDIYIDGEKVATIDAFSQTAIVKDLVYEIYGLEKGMHEIKIVNTGQKNSSGVATNINIDGIEVITRAEGAGLPILSSPIISINDHVLTYNEIDEAIGYVLKIGLHTINITGNSVNLNDIFQSNNLTSYSGKIYVYAVGDGETFNDSKLSNGLDYTYDMAYGSVEGITSRGAYIFDVDTLTQVEFTVNNTYPFFDKVFYKTPYSDFVFNASLRSDFFAPTIHSKFGVMIASSNNSYYNIFFLPENNTLYLLSTLDGGNTWVRLWESVPCTFDASTGFDLEVSRNNQTILIYVNDSLVYTENSFIIDEELPVYIGFVSEAIKQVVYANISIEGQQNLSVPSISINNEIIEFYSENAVSYLIKINDIEVSGTSPFDINAYLNSLGSDTGVYTISVKAIGDGVNFGNSSYSSSVSYSHIKTIEGTEQLSVPTIDLVDDVLNITPVENATGYTLKIEDNYQYVNIISVSSGVNIRNYLIDEGFISGTFKIAVQANGDNISYSDSIFSLSQEITIDTSLTPIKGQYLSEGSNVTMEVTGGILNADNYQTGYDKNYTTVMYTDIEISATIKFDVNIPNTSRIKFGLSFQENDGTFYYAFIDLNTNSVVLLVRYNSTWVSLWSVKFTPTLNLEEGVEISIRKVGTTVELFVNSVKLHTLEGFTLSPVNAGLVSEAGNLIHYENVTIRILD